MAERKSVPMVTKNPTIIRSRKLQAAREILDFMEKFQETNRARREAGQDPLHAANLTDEERGYYDGFWGDRKSVV